MQEEESLLQEFSLVPGLGKVITVCVCVCVCVCVFSIVIFDEG
jgi:hypothetical protein